MPQYPGIIKSKLPKVGTTIFSVMSRLAVEHQAINLSQGFPDFSCPPELLDLVENYMRKGFNQYAPMQGVMPLREAIAIKTEMLYSAIYDPETEITVCAGGTQAIYTAISAVIKEDDEVIIFEPAYDCYTPAVEMNGGNPIYIQLKLPDYRIDWNEVKKLITHRTRMIILNTPHNPTGSILTARDMQTLEKLTKDTDIIILSDEVYEHVIFDGYEHQSLARYPLLAERSFIVSSFGKTFHTTGWKIGYCIAPANLMAEFRRVHQYMVFSVNTPIQYALADYLRNADHFMGLREFYRKKRDLFISLVEGSAFKLRPSSGTYFQLLSYNDITEEKDTDFAIRLTKENGIASIPVSVFYSRPQDNKVLRFCFAKEDETLKRAAEKICAAKSGM